MHSLILVVFLVGIWTGMITPRGLAANLPPSFYVVPDRQEDFAPGYFKDDDDDEVEEGIDELFSVQGGAFDEMLEKSKTLRQSPFSLGLIRSDVGVSAGGKIGILALSGQIAVETHWYPRGQSSVVEVPEEDPPLMEISFGSEEALIRENVKRISEAAFYAGKVKNPVRMEGELNAVIRRISPMMQLPPDTRHLSWTPAKFRLQVSVSAEGQVLPLLAVGGDFRVRLDWKLPSPGEFQAKQVPETVQSFRNLVLVLSDELRNISSVQQSFRSESVDIMLGITAAGKIGIAKVSTGIVGMLTFKVNHFLKERDFSGSESPAQSILLITDQNYDGRLRKEDGSPVRSLGQEKVFTPGKVLNGEVYEIDRNQLRKGLIRAHKMAGIFAGRAIRNSQRHWSLKKIRTAYEMSVGGSLSLASLSAMVGIRILYKSTREI